jgi:phospholipid/cholesterol/gamma-HCH transport system permease protein
MDSVRKLGALALFGLRAGRMGLFLGKTFLFALSPPLKIRQLLREIHFIGFQSTLVIFLTGAFSGMVLGLQGYYTLNRFGSEAFLGPMVGLALVKELGPVLAALMVTGRAGSAMAAEIGIMRITEQIDALALMGLNPFRYLIVPKLLAGIITVQHSHLRCDWNFRRLSGRRQASRVGRGFTSERWPAT